MSNENHYPQITQLLNGPLLTLLGPQAPCNSFRRFFPGSFVFDFNYEKLQLKIFIPVASFLESSGTLMSL